MVMCACVDVRDVIVERLGVERVIMALKPELAIEQDARYDEIITSVRTTPLSDQPNHDLTWTCGGRHACLFDLFL
jgi:hypothetical protein